MVKDGLAGQCEITRVLTEEWIMGEKRLIKGSIEAKASDFRACSGGMELPNSCDQICKGESSRV
jgi:hypothetical protein